jgi:hypothetical protein
MNRFRCIGISGWSTSNGYLYGEKERDILRMTFLGKMSNCYMKVHVFTFFKEGISGAIGVETTGQIEDRTDTKMALQRTEITLTVYVADNRLSKAMP